MDVFESLAQSVVDYNPAGAGQAAQTIVDEGLDPLQGLDAISGAMKIIGDGYATGELFLPDLVAAADASQAAMPILEAEIKRRGEKSTSLGTVVIGTVKGDIHTIGKSMVGVLLTAAGFRVFDVGANVPADGFIEAIRENADSGHRVRSFVPVLLGTARCGDRRGRPCASAASPTAIRLTSWPGRMWIRFTGT